MAPLFAHGAKVDMPGEVAPGGEVNWRSRLALEQMDHLPGRSRAVWSRSSRGEARRKYGRHRRLPRAGAWRGHGDGWRGRGVGTRRGGSAEAAGGGRVPVVYLIHSHSDDQPRQRGEGGGGPDGRSAAEQAGDDSGEQRADSEPAVAPEPVNADRGRAPGGGGRRRRWRRAGSVDHSGWPLGT